MLEEFLDSNNESPIYNKFYLKKGGNLEAIKEVGFRNTEFIYNGNTYRTQLSPKEIIEKLEINDKKIGFI